MTTQPRRRVIARRRPNFPPGIHRMRDLTEVQRVWVYSHLDEVTFTNLDHEGDARTMMVTAEAVILADFAG